MGYGLVFHPAEADQCRNQHDLLRDFELEIPGYLRNESLVDLLSDLPLEPGPNATVGNLLLCYKALVLDDFFPADELRLVQAWSEDLGESVAWTEAGIRDSFSRQDLHAVTMDEG